MKKAFTISGYALLAAFFGCFLFWPVWQTLKVVAGNGSNTNIVDSAATNATRFYRVSTQ